MKSGISDINFQSIIFRASVILLLLPISLSGQEKEGWFASLGSKSDATKSEEMARYDVKFYHINLETSATSLFISGNTLIKIRTLADNFDLIVLQLTAKLNVSSATVNGNDATFTRQGDYLSITLPSAVSSGVVLDVVVAYSGTPANGPGINRTTSSTWSQTIIWTLSESFNAYHWFPVKQELTDKADSAYIYITSPRPLTAVSNGLLKRVADVGTDMRRYEWETTYPIAYYLISLTVGNYQQYDLSADVGGTTVPQPNYIYNTPGCLEQYKPAIDRTPELIELFSDLFGPYPFKGEKYGHVMAPFGGGMEHQTITMMGLFNFGLIAHELAHQWFGDYVTCATWQDIWINEGFASYSEYLAYEFTGQTATARTWLASAYDKAMTVPSGAVFLTPAEALSESRIFSSALSYKKGAALLHMLRGEIDDDELFFGSLRQFLNEFADSTATGLDFLNVVNRHTGKDYRWFFDQWYFGKGFPLVSAQYSQKPGYTKLILNQTPTAPTNPFFRMRVKVRLFSATATLDTVLNWTENEQVFTIPGDDRVTGVIVDPDKNILMQRQAAVGINDERLPDEMRLYPVPFTDELHIELPAGLTNATATITDILGKVVFRGSIFDGLVTVETALWSPGIYIYRVDSGGSADKGIVIKR